MSRKSVAAAVLASVVAFAGEPADGASITFVFDHYTVPPHKAPHTPIPGGPFGTLTISDSATDPNRVDIDLMITPPPAYGAALLERFYLNFGGPGHFLTNHKFYLVKQGTPVTGPANKPFTADQLLGSVGYAEGVSVFDFAQFVFDLSPNPSTDTQHFVGSLALYNQLLNPDAPVNLDAAMFDFLSGGTNTPPMYAAYRTTVFDVNPNNPSYPDGEFWAFASSKPVPEPSSLALLGAALGGLAAWRARSWRTGQAS